jgi:hypothetical protein
VPVLKSQAFVGSLISTEAILIIRLAEHNDKITVKSIERKGHVIIM